MNSAIYVGTVQHERMRPRRHRLNYRVFCLLLDLDEVPTLRLPPFISFRDSDHGDGKNPLRDWAAGLLKGAGIAYDGGRINLLCYPRLLGYVFNPLSVYFCHRRSGDLAGILFEVHNTHSERHTYVMPATGDGVVRHTAKKQFFVSPFMPMDCTYRFRIAPPGSRVGVSILEDDAEGLLLTASFTGRRHELSSGALWGLLLSHPLMTLKVTAAIHWEALKLLAKGVRMLKWHPARERIATSVPMTEEQPAVGEVAVRTFETRPG